MKLFGPEGADACCCKPIAVSISELMSVPASSNALLPGTQMNWHESDGTARVHPGSKSAIGLADWPPEPTVGMIELIPPAGRLVSVAISTNQFVEHPRFNALPCVNQQLLTVMS